MGSHLSHHLGRALQMTNILRDIDEDAAMGRLYLPREALAEAGIADADIAEVLANPTLDQACSHPRRARAAAFRRGRKDHGALRAQQRTLAPPDGRRLSPHARQARRTRLAPAAPKVAPLEAAGHMGDPASRPPLMANGTVHIIGAGLAGLSAAVELAGSGRKVIVHELARYAGGRCRSYFEPALGLTIDNGNHLLLSGNHAALALLKTIGSGHALVGPEEAEFAFADLASGARWLVRPNMGPLPWWIFSSARRVPGTRAIDYLRACALLLPTGDRRLGEVMSLQRDAL